MTDGVAFRRAFRTEVIISAFNEELIGPQRPTKPRAHLIKRSLPRTRKGFDGRMYSGRAGFEDAVRVSVKLRNCNSNGGSMKIVFNRNVVRRRYDAAALEGSEGRVVFGGEGLSKRARSGRRRDDRMGWMRFDEGLRKVLTTKHVKVIVDRHHLRLVMQMFEGGRCVRAGHRAQTLILHRLQLLDMRRFQIRRVKRCGIVDDGGADRFVREEKIVRAMPPVRAGKRL